MQTPQNTPTPPQPSRPSNTSYGFTPLSPSGSQSPMQTPASHSPTQPTMQGQLPQTPSGAGGAAWQRLKTWFAARTTGQRVGISIGAGCSTLLVACLMCSCIGAALGSSGTSTTGNSNNNVGAVVSTQTADQSQQQATATAITTTTAAATATATATTIPATPTPKPTATAIPRPTATPRPKPTCIPGAVNCNPWGYNFSCCNYIYSPPSTFCYYFKCIPSFWTNTNGYVEECQDGMYSHSGGRSGSCSYHGGNWRALLKP